MPPLDAEPPAVQVRAIRRLDLNQLPPDEAQELKEAVCDALLERTRRVVSGERDYGAAILGSKPSRVLSSGFLVPRLNSGDEDESNDIQIPTHGIDFRIHAAERGEIVVRTKFSLYARVLPTSAEVFDQARGLRPKAQLNAAAASHLQDVLHARVRAEIDPTNIKGPARQKARAAILLSCYKEMGILHPAGDAIGEDMERDAGADDGGAVFQGERGEDLQIPDALSVPFDVPERYVRIEVAVPDLALPLPYDRGAWQAAADAHEVALNLTTRRAFEDWLATEDGRRMAWRNVRAPSSAFWSTGSWDAFLERIRNERPQPELADLFPGMRAKVLVQPAPEPLEPGTVTVRIALENHKVGIEDLENGLFQASISIEVPRDALRWMPMERVKRSYHLAGFMRVPAMGLNAGVIHVESAGSHLLRSTWAPRFVLPRMQPTSFPNVPVAYEMLSVPTTDVSVLRELPREMRAWIAALRADPKLFDGDSPPTDDERAIEVRRFEDDLEAWEAEADRCSLGVALLERSRAAWLRNKKSPEAHPYHAWLLMNLSFHRANKRRAGADAPGWRLFQLGFILAHLPTLASRLQIFSGAFMRRDLHVDRGAHVDRMAAEGRFFDAAFDEESASLLYMSTGGGKSEAFYGVLTFALFLDRLRGKHRGITAMLHYPLRLLTLQQAQRLARLLASAEIVRHDAEGVGGAPFEIGFWVGGGNTPNYITNGDTAKLNEDGKSIPAWEDAGPGDEDALLKADRAYAANSEAWNKLPECPFCRGRTVLRRYKEYRQRLGIVCTDRDRPKGAPDVRCPWNARNFKHKRPEPLPFLLTDMDCYRNAPAVMLGTIDKLALIGQHPTTINRIAGMFGMARWVDGNGLLSTPTDPKLLAVVPEGTSTVAPSHANGKEVFFDPVPSLIVQDEMHLLEESLGTFGGIFETGLLAWFGELAKELGPLACRDLQGEPRLPHVIGATATASDVACQIRAIYRRGVVQFPHPGPRLYASFYTQLKDFEAGGEAAAERTIPASTPMEREKGAPWARVYESMLTNGRAHTAATISILSAYACGITRLLRDLASGDGARQEAALNELIGNVSDAQWGQRRVAALERQRGRPRGYDLLATLVDLHRIQLTYVTNKKGGDQILSALIRQAEKDHAAMGSAYAIGARFDMELISGGVDVKTIQEVIEKAEAEFDFGAEDIEKTLRCIVATSAISHGVDVSALNAMAFAGMPSDIAEYIQASSRVARSHVGYSLLIPTPQNRRDRFIVEVHEGFHRFLDRMIAPPAIERWADKAIRRTIPSLVQLYFAGVLYQRQYHAADGAEKLRVTLPGTVPALRDEMEHRHTRGRWDPRDGAAAVENCIAFIQRAIGTEDGHPVPSVGHYRDLIRNEVNLIVTEVTSGKHGSDLSHFWESHYHKLDRPMTSLRDVDEAGEIRAATSVSKGKISLERMGAAMAFIRNRRPGRASSSGELDHDSGNGRE